MNQDSSESLNTQTSPNGADIIRPAQGAQREVIFDKPEFRWQFSICIACVILGILVTMLFKTYRKEGSPLMVSQKEELAKMVKYLEGEKAKLQADLAKARQTINEFEDTSTKGKDEFDTLRKQLLEARQESGLTNVRGPGLMIVLNDSKIKPKPDDDPNYYIVHDVDLITLVNELWASGAEAISINEQRVVMTTAIRCVGPTITVNTERLSPPYVVRVIGPAENLETGLKYTGGFMDNMAPNIDRGVQIKIAKSSDLSIKAYNGSLVNRFARSVESSK
ncbi:MAG: DUF881 domain-containing protein [Firmicutes bacterium]|nr:DUF881 domain-containing protein [Bacillota bacterium]